MVKLIKNTLTLLIRQQTSIFSAASIIMVTVAFSRVLGLYRDRLLAARFPPAELGVYYAAFRLPNMIFELLVMGALATAFIPVFTSYLDTKGKTEAFKMAAVLINIGIIIFSVMAIPVFIFAKQISLFLAPGFSSSQIELMTSFTRIMILAQVFPLIIGNFFTGILQSFKNFLLPSIAPVVYNLGIIIGIIFLTPVFGLYAPVIGVVIGAFLFTFIQLPAVFSFGYRHSFDLSTSNRGVREVGRLMLPRTLGLAVSQIDTTVDLILSSLLGSGAVTVFNFAQHLQQVPIGLFGSSIAQATLPALSFAYAKKNMSDYKKIFLSSFHQIFFLVVPISVILIVLRIPIVRLVFGSSTLFDWNSTVVTGQTLAYFSLSLFAQSLIQLLARSFYSLHDTKTPVVIGGFCVILNTVLSVLFILYFHLDVWSLGLSTSVANIVNMVLLLLYLQKKIEGFNNYQVYMPVVKILLSGIVAGVALYLPIKILDQLVFDTTRTINLILLTGTSTLIGIFVYIFTAWFLDVPQIALLVKLYRRKKDKKTPIYIDTAKEMVDAKEADL
ncbi:murein biosynthesis integral membrane protein MurJ [Candidatus Gottesmanbacteria bacterium RBG_13_37_7]|uniref:Probable lipid II flippase MurJ n=1 Tax=Candidatus Gottesmanbacteria bacterium RBG_13_37_7 TaxID=1798369 RepID=A0A1F5YJJ8_9BACT|nr:MAG: murein biosynthesis integral membrane protein MurJ [Candidatus Gottesmanbacteria bacterium RBG_13_37_7]